MFEEPRWVKQIRQREDPFVWHRIGNEKLAEDMKRLLDHQQEWRGLGARAHQLVECLKGYDGSGIPSSDASDAFALLREMQALLHRQTAPGE